MSDRAAPAIRILRADPGATANQWRERVAEAWRDGGGRVLKDSPGGRVEVLELGGKPMVLKTRPIGSLLDRIRVEVGLSRHARHWHGARWLAAKGFSTPRPLARGVLRGGGLHGGRSAEFLLLEFIPGKTVLRHLSDRDLGVREEHAVARSLARDMVRFFTLGRFNRDHKPSNLLVVEPVRGDVGVRVAVLDADSIRPSTVANFNSAERMAASLVIEAIGCGCEPRRALKARVIHEFVAQFERLAGLTSEASLSHRDRRARLWRCVARRVAAHGNPTPTINPLRGDTG
ncbi:MAG: hypothetical protein KF745_08525 [Phycisphaeraceae bacterium]|nr:hypothetical protein [Phycisphaeraceae bacterium]